MNVINPIKERQVKNAALAGEVMAFAAHAQFNADGFIKDDVARAESIISAAKQSPLFEGAADEFIAYVAPAWAQSVAEYANTHGKYPSEELLADAYNSCHRLLLETAPGKTHHGFTAAMFEAVANPAVPSGTMSDSQGVMRLALFAALILPVALGATTADAVTFVPCERDESDIYKVTQVAASKFGDYAIGQELDMQSAGVYAHFHRHGVFGSKTGSTKPDGTLTDFTLTTAQLETGPGKDIPVRAGRVRFLVNRMQARNYDDGSGVGIFNIKDAKGDTYTANYEIDYLKGIFKVTDTKINGVNTVAPWPADVEIAVTFELDVEALPEIIPLVNQKMEKWTVKPSQYALASTYTVQALFDAQREFGLDLSSQLFNGARNWLSHETDMKRLREMAFHTCYGGKIHISYDHARSLDAYLMHLKQQLSRISTEMVQRTKASGIRGGFAGQSIANFFKSLPSSVWTAAPGYQESPYVQFCGTLFGYIRIYEVPARVSEALTKEYPLGEDQVLFYGRGDNIGDAGLIAGDAVPAIPFVHPTNYELVNRTTLWGSAINIVHPDHGEDYFYLATFNGDKTGSGFNPVAADLYSEVKGVAGPVTP
ncbi:capsid protein [Enterobacter hormaechei]